MNHTILHLTDFHIELSGTKPDLFSDSNYEIYLNKLVNEINEKNIKIDSIIFTGDFVHMGKVENFIQADKVIEYLLNKLNVSIENIGICIGNHDIKCYNDSGDKIDDNKDGYNDFSKKYVNKCLHSGNGFFIKNISEGVYFLSLDATIERNGNKPGRFPNDLRSEIIDNLVRLDINHPNKLLIIGSHYPMTAFYEESLNDENFFERGLWRSAMPLFAQIKNKFKQSKLLWLFGDLHYPDHLIEEDGRSIAVLSGRIGISVPNYSTVSSSIDTSLETLHSPQPIDTEVIKKSLSDAKGFIGNLSQQPRMASVICFNDAKDTAIIRFKYITNGHEDNLEGHWESYDGKTVKYPCNVPEIIPFVPKLNIEEDVNPSAFDDEENPIMKKIIDGRLYKFGRFTTREDEVSLGWVPLNEIIGDQLILPQIIINSKHWIERVLSKDELTKEKTLLVGIDFWGAVIASQLSIMTGLKNHCRASALRGKEEDYLTNEMFCEGLTLSHEENIILITDVVSSGRTLYSVYQKLLGAFDKKTLCIKKAICISVLSDRNQDRKVKLDFLTRFGTLCGDVRIPVVDKNFLPDERLLPSQTIYI